MPSTEAVNNENRDIALSLMVGVNGAIGSVIRNSWAHGFPGGVSPIFRTSVLNNIPGNWQIAGILIAANMIVSAGTTAAMGLAGGVIGNAVGGALGSIAGFTSGDGIVNWGTALGAAAGG